MKVDFKSFDAIYQGYVEDVCQFLNPEMQVKIAMNNVGWNPPYDFKRYLQKSTIRFYKAYLEIPENAKNCCDLGGFWGAFPLTLAKLGYTSTMTEVLKFYDNTFDPLFDFIRKNGVEIIDIDPFSTELSNLKFDYITALAILEHIPDSLQFFLSNVKSAMNSNAIFYIDVPNIAYVFKRIELLRGKSPLPDIMDIYHSRAPFIGHHHEFTVNELERLMNFGGFKLVTLNRFNYSIDVNLKFAVQHPIHVAAMALFPNNKELIGASFKQN